MNVVAKGPDLSLRSGRRTGMHREAPQRINKEIIDFLAQ